MWLPRWAVGDARVRPSCRGAGSSRRPAGLVTPSTDAVTPQFAFVQTVCRPGSGQLAYTKPQTTSHLRIPVPLRGVFLGEGTGNIERSASAAGDSSPPPTRSPGFAAFERKRPAAMPTKVSMSSEALNAAPWAAQWSTRSSRRMPRREGRQRLGVADPPESARSRMAVRRRCPRELEEEVQREPRRALAARAASSRLRVSGRAGVRIAHPDLLPPEEE